MRKRLLAAARTYGPRRSPSSLSLTVVAVVVILATTSCATPKFQAEVATQLNQVGDEMQAQRQDMALLQEQIDSLKTVAAKQDTLLRRLANLAGVQIPGTGNGEQGTR
jgi:hypothetical protein